MRIFKLAIDNHNKEFYLLNKLLEEQFTSDSLLENLQKASKVIYVATSQLKIKRLNDYLGARKNNLLSPKLVTIWQLFDLLYDFLPPRKKSSKRKITDVYANIIIKHILLEKKALLFPTPDFSLSGESSNFFLEWVKKIKEYNLHLVTRDGEIRYREDAPVFDLRNKENRFNERLLTTLRKVFEYYELFLLNNELFDEADKAWWTIDHLKPESLRNMCFYVEHLSILTTVEKNLFERIYSNADAISLLDYAFPFPHPQFTTTGIVKGEKETIEVPNTHKETTRNIRLYAYDKKDYEVENIVRELNKEDIVGKVVIVSPEIDEYEKPFRRIFPLYSKIPPSVGKRKLSELPVIKTCLAILEIIQQQLRRRAVVSFLVSPYINLLQEKEKRIIDIRTKEQIIVSGNDWERLWNSDSAMQKVSKFIKQLTMLESKKGIAFIDAYITILDTFLYLQVENDLKAYNKFLEFISSLRRKPIKETIDKFGIKDFQKILLSYCDSVKLQTNETVSKNIEILSIEQTGGMNFGRVYLIGLVESKIPKGPKHNPLFSEKLTEEMGFPAYDMLYSLSKFNFESVTKSAETARLSYYKRDEKGNVFLKSPFVQGILEEKGERSDSIDTMLDWQIGIGEIVHQNPDTFQMLSDKGLERRTLLIKEGVKRFRDMTGPQNVQEMVKSIKGFKQYVENRILKLSKGISPFALEAYNKCPFSFLLSYILKISELRDPEQGIDSSIRGRVIHKILADFYRRRLEKKIKKTGTADWEEIKEIALESIEEMAPGARDKILLRLELISKTHKPLLKDFLNLETLKNEGHTVKDVEWQFTGKEVSISMNGERLGLLGRIDRIDKGKEGLIIFDYKTGSKKNLPTANKIMKGGSFQFPIYRYAVEHCIGRVSRLTYYVLNSEDGVLLEQRPKIPNEVLIKNIFDVWKEIKELNFPPVHSSNCESSCSFSELCRSETEHK